MSTIFLFLTTFLFFPGCEESSETTIFSYIEFDTDNYYPSVKVLDQDGFPIENIFVALSCPACAYMDFSASDSEGIVEFMVFSLKYQRNTGNHVYDVTLSVQVDENKMAGDYFFNQPVIEAKLSFTTQFLGTLLGTTVPLE